MASLFYLPSTGTPSVSPAFDAAWDDVSAMIRLEAVRTKISSTNSAKDFSDSDKTDLGIGLVQYVTEPLSAQTIAAQVVKWQMQGHEDGSANNLFMALSIRSWNGSTFQTLLSLTRDDVELTSTTTNRQFSATTTARTVAAGDRLIFEVGYGGDPTPSGSHSGGIRIGDDNASNLPEDDTTTTNLNPWIEFANTLSFQSEPTNYDLWCATGLYAGTYPNAILAGKFSVLSASGGYAGTYPNSILARSLALLNQAGSYSGTYSDSLLLVNLLMLGSPGSYLVTSDGAILTYESSAVIYELWANSGAYGLTGSDSILALSRALLSNAGITNLDSQGAILAAFRAIFAAPGSLAVDGNNSILAAIRTMLAQTGAYGFTGHDAILEYLVVGVYKLLVASGVYSKVGEDVIVAKLSALLSEAGTVTVTGGNSVLARALAVLGTAGTMVVAGGNAILARARTILSTVGTFVWSSLGAILKQAGFFQRWGTATLSIDTPQEATISAETLEDITIAATEYHTATISAQTEDIEG